MDDFGSSQATSTVAPKHHELLHFGMSKLLAKSYDLA